MVLRAAYNGHVGGWFIPVPKLNRCTAAGAGAIISNTLMDKRPYQVVADHIVNRDYYGSGDSILTGTMWHQFGVHPTDPGQLPNRLMAQDMNEGKGVDAASCTLHFTESLKEHGLCF